MVNSETEIVFGTDIKTNSRSPYRRPLNLQGAKNILVMQENSLEVRATVRQLSGPSPGGQDIAKIVDTVDISGSEWVGEGDNVLLVDFGFVATRQVITTARTMNVTGNMSGGSSVISVSYSTTTSDFSLPSIVAQSGTESNSYNDSGILRKSETVTMRYARITLNRELAENGTTVRSYVYECIEGGGRTRTRSGLSSLSIESYDPVSATWKTVIPDTEFPIHGARRNVDVPNAATLPTITPIGVNFSTDNIFHKNFFDLLNMSPVPELRMSMNVVGGDIIDTSVTVVKIF